MAIELFVDTNNLLAFYEFTQDDLTELEKLTVLLTKGEVTLYLPEQVRDEFERNRETRLASALRTLKEQDHRQSLPIICRDYAAFSDLQSARRAYGKAHAALAAELAGDIERKTLKADKVTGHLFSRARVVSTEELLDLARDRVDLGRPPGKRGSLGDAVNWEALLKEVPSGADLHFVTGDSDFVSKVDKARMGQYLADEWRREKASEVRLYPNLSTFFGEHFPAIRLRTELEKELAIQDLANSISFRETHAVVARLNRWRDFTSVEREAVVEAAMGNDQVWGIILDSDVAELLESIVRGHETEISGGLVAAYDERRSEVLQYYEQ